MLRIAIFVDYKYNFSIFPTIKLNKRKAVVEVEVINPKLNVLRKISNTKLITFAFFSSKQRKFHLHHQISLFNATFIDFDTV